MNIPVECERTKNVYVAPEFIKALEETCNWKKAERLPEDSFQELYIGSQILSSMLSSDNQIIWGRRGTGKTHLLKAFTQKINEDPECFKMAYYISCDQISTESPFDVKFTSDVEKMKYCAKQTFKSFVVNLIEQIINNYDNILSSKFLYNESYDESQKQEIKKNIDKQLFKLWENCTTGLPSEIVKEETEIKQKTNKRSHENSVDSEIKGKVVFPLSFIAYLKAKVAHKTNGNSINLDSGETKITTKFSFSLSKTREILESLLDALKIETLFICIDELWLIDSKRELSLQPLFLDYIRQTFLSSHRISIKIASIREVTKLNNKNSAGNTYGLQSGHDIFELINLDTRFNNDKERLSHYKNMLYTRINYFARTAQDGCNEYSEEYIVETIFKNEVNLTRLIILTHVIPRNFLNVLQRTLMSIQFDLQHYYVHSYLIRHTVIKLYLEDKRSNLPMNSGSLFDTINKYIASTQNFFFILSTQEVKRLKIEIDNLVYVEIIHQIPSSSLPEEYMDNYKGFYIDSGKYLHTLQNDSKKLEEDFYVFSYILPKEISDNIEQYIISVDNITSEFIECPNCGSRISKHHPVYEKVEVCPTCAFEFK